MLPTEKIVPGGVRSRGRLLEAPTPRVCGFFEREYVRAMASVEAEIQRGVALLEAGRLQEADRVFRKLRNMSPDHNGVRHFSGVIQVKTGQVAAGLAAVRRSIDAEPDNLHLRVNFANLLQETGDLVAAEMVCRNVISQNPAFGFAFNGLGIALLQQGRATEAVDALTQALLLLGAQTRVRLSLAKALIAADRFDDALIELNALNQNGTATIEVDALRARALAALGLNNEARALAKTLLSADASNLLASVVLAACDVSAGDEPSSVRRLKELSEKHPRAFMVWSELLASAIRAAKLPEIRRCIEQMMQINAEHAPLRFAHGELLMWEKSYAAGWLEREWRTRGGDPLFTPLPLAKPVWNGRPLNDRRLLIVSEGGFGDILQFVRFLEPAADAAQADKLFFDCYPKLLPLLQACPSVLAKRISLVTRGDPIPETDAVVNLMTLPMVLGTTIDTVPAKVPYLRAPTAMVKRWRSRLDKYDGVKVGIVWAGGDLTRQGSHRWIPFAKLDRLLRTSGVTFFSLQVGATQEAIHEKLVDLGPSLTDFSETAAAICNLDLVLTVDTSVAHLALALGASTWVMLPHRWDWRWPLDSDRTPWYPTARLFRQARTGGWDDVIEPVRRALIERVQ